MNLVLINKNTYSFYSGKTRVSKCDSPNMNKTWLEFYRKNPVEVIKALNSTNPPEAA